MSTKESRFGLNVRRATRANATSAHIFLQRVVRQENGMLAVTPICTSLAELEGEVDDLRHELEDVLR